MRFKYKVLLGRDEDHVETGFIQSHRQHRTLKTCLAKLASPLTIFLLVFGSLYLSILIYCRWAFYADPTSLFFDFRYAYKEKYSLIRKQEANAFIEAALSQIPGRQGTSVPDICLGVPTIAREGKQYVRDTIGSLLHGLEDDQRERLELIIFIAHTDPSVHPLYHEPWVRHLSDKVLVYGDDIEASKMAQLHHFEENRLFLNKSLFDYTYILQHCYDTGAAVISVVEDDTLACKGWFPRVRAAIDEIVTIEQPANWLYLRMFYTEIYLGWQRENIVQHTGLSLMVISIVVTPMIIVRTRYPNLRGTLTNRIILLIVTLCLLCIGLFFSAGHLRLQPLHDGVQRMPRNGCCGQGMIFPREIVPSMIRYLDEQKRKYVDSALEIWADQNRFDRWVVVPSLLQHEGRKSSKGAWSDDAANASDPYEIYNFRFENYPENGLL